MTEKDMRKLNRCELLEMLLFQTKRVEALEKRLSELEIQADNRSSSGGSANGKEKENFTDLLLQIKSENIQFLNIQKEMMKKTVDVCNEMLKEAKLLKKN